MTAANCYGIEEDHALEISQQSSVPLTLPAERQSVTRARATPASQRPQATKALEIAAVAYEPEGCRVYAGLTNGDLRLWQVSPVLGLQGRSRTLTLLPHTLVQSFKLTTPRLPQCTYTLLCWNRSSVGLCMPLCSRTRPSWLWPASEAAVLDCAAQRAQSGAHVDAGGAAQGHHHQPPVSGHSCRPRCGQGAAALRVSRHHHQGLARQGR